jgi:small subunit ribosomal protein S10
MTQPARVKLTSISLPKLGQVCDEIMGIGEKTGVKVKGPIPLPVKRLNVVTRKSPCGNGTETYEKWEMKMHRRIIDINADDKAIRQLMRLKIPDNVYIELSLT